MTSPVIAPSILACDYSRFGDEARRAEEAGGDWLHVDIMDGHFVPNISFGPEITAMLKRFTRLPLDVHLMIERPDLYVDAFLKAGAARISIHVEPRYDILSTLKRIRTGGCAAGIALNPTTPDSAVEAYLGEIDLVLCMTVVPGFGGQKFMPKTMDKVKRLATHSKRQNHFYHIEVDGGIHLETAKISASCGATAFVAGTSLFASKDMKRAVTEMREGILSVKSKME